tara:strand:- start:1461 stop:1706 length:246 start_codon:yes stop_codon:yes gene_type:complete
MSKQLILITAPFNCGHCKQAQQELPDWTRKNGWEYTEIEDDPKDQLGTDTYPTIMVRVNEKMVDTIVGYNKENLLEKLSKY